MNKNQTGTYTTILLWVFKHGKKDPSSGDLLFSQEDLRKAATQLRRKVRNFPDLTYNLRSRSPLPQEILDAGYTTIAIRGRGQYALVVAEDKVEIPDRTTVDRIFTNKIPKAIRDLLRKDEQSILSAMRYMEVVQDFVGARAFHLQGHLRTTGGLGQQVEADDVWVAVQSNGRRVIIPIEAKGPNERIGRHQMMSTVDAVLKKIPNFRVMPLAVQLEETGKLAIVQFSYKLISGKVANLIPMKFKRYKPEPKLPLWP